MPTYEENKRDNQRIRERGQQGRDLEDYTAPIDSVIEGLKNYKSTGNIDNTEDARAVRAEIERLESIKQQGEEQFKQSQGGDIQGGGAGQGSPSGTGNGMPTFEERERASGLNFAGNNTMSGRGQDNPTMDEREAAAGLRDTTSGRDFFQEQSKSDKDLEESAEEQIDDPFGSVGVIVAINGEPYSASFYGQIGGKLVN
tara:strand:+ start:1204 stop:1800 length:597 start_codon:yes stop_codon:yes gene_type:complete